jgi:hypothetical protein
MILLFMNFVDFGICGTNNPNILELLNTPSDCIIYKMIYLIVYLSIEMIFLLRYVQVLLVVMQNSDR